jgi:hypothetical protein
VDGEEDGETDETNKSDRLDQPLDDDAETSRPEPCWLVGPATATRQMSPPLTASDARLCRQLALKPRRETGHDSRVNT